MTDGIVRTETPAPGVALVTIDRPDKRNAMTPEMIAQMHEAFEQSDRDESISVIILTGAGEKAFCAGHDIKAIEPGTPVAQVKQEMEARLRAFFYTQGHTVPSDAVEIQQVDDSGVPDQDLLAIRLRTPRYVLDRPVSLVMGLPVPRGT